MRFSKTFSAAVSFFMCIMMSNVPALAVAESKMISTSDFVSSMDRAQKEQEVQNFLSRDEVRQELIKRGVSPDEVSARLASLSDQELRELSGQVQYARAGGDILFTILIVVLIIFLIKRI